MAFHRSFMSLANFPFPNGEYKNISNNTIGVAR